MGQPDYYQLLGVSADASAGELEAAYWRITALFGPDANPEPFAAKIHAAASKTKKRPSGLFLVPMCATVPMGCGTMDNHLFLLSYYQIKFNQLG